MFHNLQYCTRTGVPEVVNTMPPQLDNSRELPRESVDQRAKSQNISDERKRRRPGEDVEDGEIGECSSLTPLSITWPLTFSAVVRDASLKKRRHSRSDRRNEISREYGQELEDSQSRHRGESSLEGNSVHHRRHHRDNHLPVSSSRRMNGHRDRSNGDRNNCDGDEHYRESERYDVRQRRHRSRSIDRTKDKDRYNHSRSYREDREYRRERSSSSRHEKDHRGKDLREKSRHPRRSPDRRLSSKDKKEEGKDSSGSRYLHLHDDHDRLEKRLRAASVEEIEDDLGNQEEDPEKFVEEMRKRRQALLEKFRSRTEARCSETEGSERECSETEFKLDESKTVSNSFAPSEIINPPAYRSPSCVPALDGDGMTEEDAFLLAAADVPEDEDEEDSTSKCRTSEASSPVADPSQSPEARESSKPVSIVSQ